MKKCKLKEHNLSINMRWTNDNNIDNHNTRKISILNNNNTLHRGGVQLLDVEDNNKDGGFGWVRGQVLCYNFWNQGHFSRDYQIPTKTCTYCKTFDHTIEQCPQLIMKWKDITIDNPNPVQNLNLNPNPNIQINSFEPRQPQSFVVTRASVAMGSDKNT